MFINAYLNCEPSILSSRRDMFSPYKTQKSKKIKPKDISELAPIKIFSAL